MMQFGDKVEDIIKKKIKERSNAIKELSEELNAQYYSGIEKVADRFNLRQYSSMEDSNVIVGNIEGYDYCFVEFYLKKTGKNGFSRWISAVSFRMKDERFPDFSLSSIKEARKSVGCGIFAGSLFFLPLVIPFIILIYHFISQSGNSNYDYSLITGLFVFMLIFGSIFSIMGYFFMSSSIRTYKELNNQGKYNIRDFKFKEKYVILSDSDPYSISRLFDDKICSRILNFSPEITGIDFMNKCINEIIENKQLNLDFCKERLDVLLRQARIFDKDSNDF